MRDWGKERWRDVEKKRCGDGVSEKKRDGEKES